MKEAQEALAIEKDKSNPKFKAEIKQIISYPIPAQPERIGCFMVISVLNCGADSVALNYKVSFITGGELLEGKLVRGGFPTNSQFRRVTSHLLCITQEMQFIRRLRAQ